MLDSSKIHIAIFTQQAGAVEAFYPLLSVFKNKHWSYELFASGAAYDLWQAKDEVPKLTDEIKKIDLDAVSIVLTGTSLKVREEAEFWNMGITMGIPTIGFVDSWVNYSERFTIDKPLDVMPDFIYVVDDLMQKRMIESGVSKDKLRIVGHPRFDTLSKNFFEYTPNTENGTAINIVFYTDPVIPDIKNVKEIAGYDAEGTVRRVIKELHHSSDCINLIIKPHPREQAGFYQKILDDMGLNDWIKISGDDPIRLMRKADIVFGMNSILLIDSLSIGLPTVSFQPNRKLKRNDITDRKGVIVIKDEKEISSINEILKNLKPRNLVKKCCSESTILFIKQLTEIIAYE